MCLLSRLTIQVFRITLKGLNPGRFRSGALAI